jgi:hypothetical protein
MDQRLKIGRWRDRRGLVVLGSEDIARRWDRTPRASGRLRLLVGFGFELEFAKNALGKKEFFEERARRVMRQGIARGGYTTGNDSASASWQFTFGRGAPKKIEFKTCLCAVVQIARRSGQYRIHFDMASTLVKLCLDLEYFRGI